MDKTNIKGAILALVAIAIGVLVLALALDGPSGSETATTTTTTTTTTTLPETTTTTAPTPTVRAPSQVTLVIANGTDVDGAAGKLTDTLKGLGYITEQAHNTTEPQNTYNIFYLPGWEEEAKVVARAIGAINDQAVNTLVQPLPINYEFAEVGDSVIVIIIGKDASLINSEPVASPEDVSSNSATS